MSKPTPPNRIRVRLSRNGRPLNVIAPSRIPHIGNSDRWPFFAIYELVPDSVEIAPKLSEYGRGFDDAIRAIAHADGEDVDAIRKKYGL